jgi:SAM-dependent methyltransferase
MNKHTLQPSSTVFSEYARYYDLLYKDKNYVGESEYIHGLIQRFAPGARTVLELGSGTGKHAALLARKSYQIHGVEISTDMLARAQALKENAGVENALEFTQGDIRDVRIGKTFDVVLSLFHVFSYMTTNDDLLAAFATARTHLKPGGILIFDCWYGPAVLTERPSVRIKRMEDDQIQVTRLAEPVLHPNDNVVDVNYHVLIRNRQTEAVTEIKETHHMRYLFRPEIELLTEQGGFKVLHSEEWITGRKPGFDTWGVCFVARTSV